MRTLLGGDLALVALNLTSTRIGSEGLRVLGEAKLNLARLGLGTLGLRDDDLAPLLAAAWIRGLEHLGLQDNRLSDACVELLIASLGSASTQLDVARNALSPAGATSLERTFGPRVSGQHRQYAGRSGPVLHGGSGLRFVPQPEKPAPSPMKKPSPTVKRARLAGLTSISSAWWGGFDSAGGTARAVLISSRGAKVTPDPPIPVTRTACFDVCAEARLGSVVTNGGGIFVVELDSGASTRLGDARAALGHLSFLGERLFVLHAESLLGGTALEVFARDGNAWRRTHQLEGFPAAHLRMANNDGNTMLLLGPAHGSGKVSIVTVHDDIRYRGYVDGFDIVTGPGGPYLWHDTGWAVES